MMLWKISRGSLTRFALLPKMRWRRNITLLLEAGTERWLQQMAAGWHEVTSAKIARSSLRITWGTVSSGMGTCAWEEEMTSLTNHCGREHQKLLKAIWPPHYLERQKKKVAKLRLTGKIVIHHQQSLYEMFSHQHKLCTVLGMREEPILTDWQTCGPRSPSLNHSLNNTRIGLK